MQIRRTIHVCKCSLNLKTEYFKICTYKIISQILFQFVFCCCFCAFFYKITFFFFKSKVENLMFKQFYKLKWQNTFVWFYFRSGVFIYFLFWIKKMLSFYKVKQWMNKALEKTSEFWFFLSILICSYYFVHREKNIIKKD